MMKGLLDSLRKLGMAPILAFTGAADFTIGLVAFLELGGVSTSRMMSAYSDPTGTPGADCRPTESIIRSPTGSRPTASA